MDARSDAGVGLASLGSSRSDFNKGQKKTRATGGGVESAAAARGCKCKVCGVSGTDPGPLDGAPPYAGRAWARLASRSAMSIGIATKFGTCSSK